MMRKPESTLTLIQITHRLRNAPEVRDAQGWKIQPYKAVLETRGDKTRVVLHGRSSARWGAGKVNFNVIGYKYQPPPDWLRELLSINT